MCGTIQGGFAEPTVAGPGAPLLAICSAGLELGGGAAAAALALALGATPASGGVYGAFMTGGSCGVAVPASGSMNGALMCTLSGGS
jgi:hypothetical protein